MNSLPKLALVLMLLQTAAIQAAVTVTNISAGGEHTLFLESDGSLWATGYNGQGQLGDGTSDTTNSPAQIVSGGVVAIAAGYNYSLFVESDGSLWAMGNDDFGQLGDGNQTGGFGDSVGPTTPEQILPGGVVAVSGCYSRSVFIMSDGSLWGMGGTTLGGTPTGGDYLTPVELVTSGVTAIATGEAFSLFVKSDGSLWAMGFDAYGQLGDGNLNWNVVPTPERIVSSGVVAVAAGGEYSLFLKSNGSLWAMGLNNTGQLGDGTITDRARPEQIVSNGVVAIAADRDGSGTSMFIKSDGSLWGMGNNGSGQLGDGTHDSRVRPELIVSNGVTAVSVGGDFSVFLKSDGSLWAMGDGSSGQFGVGFTHDSSSVPVQIVPLPQPVLTESISSKTNLQLNAACQFGGTFCLLASADLSVPLNQWTPVWTNVISSRTNWFSATLTNAVSDSPSQEFYTLESQ